MTNFFNQQPRTHTKKCDFVYWLFWLALAYVCVYMWLLINIQNNVHFVLRQDLRFWHRNGPLIVILSKSAKISTEIPQVCTDIHFYLSSNNSSSPSIVVLILEPAQTAPAPTADSTELWFEGRCSFSRCSAKVKPRVTGLAFTFISRVSGWWRKLCDGWRRCFFMLRGGTFLESRPRDTADIDELLECEEHFSLHFRGWLKRNSSQEHQQVKISTTKKHYKNYSNLSPVTPFIPKVFPCSWSYY